MVATSGIEDGEDILAVKSIKYGISAGHRTYLINRGSVEVTVVNANPPLVMLFYQHHGVTHARIGWFDDTPIQKLINGVINDAPFQGTDVPRRFGEKLVVLDVNRNTDRLDNSRTTIKRESHKFVIQELSYGNGWLSACPIGNGDVERCIGRGLRRIAVVGVNKRSGSRRWRLFFFFFFFCHLTSHAALCRGRGVS